MIAYYVSGHGYGHATRTIAILSALLRTLSPRDIEIRTEAPHWLFQSLNAEVPLVRTQIDSGVAERDIFRTDVAKTVEDGLLICGAAGDIVTLEAQYLRRRGCRLIVGDIPYLIGPIAKKLGVPSVAVGNFSWDHIYRAYTANYPRAKDLVSQIEEWYRLVDVLLRLPFGHEMTAFSNVVDMPLVCRRGTTSIGQTKRDLGLDPLRSATVLIALRHPTSVDAAVRDLAQRGCNIVAIADISLRVPGLVVLNQEWSSRFVDVVSASDVVVSKLGYGIASECAAAGVPLLYPPRLNYVEHGLLKRGLGKVLANSQMSKKDFETGEWWKHIEPLLSARRMQNTADGDLEVSRQILKLYP
jgi:L-arabinokinase